LQLRCLVYGIVTPPELNRIVSEFIVLF